MKHSDREDLLFLYMAGALDAEQRDEVDAWIASRAPDVATRLAQAELEVARLAAMQPPVDPGADVRERLLARVAQPSAAPAPVAIRQRRTAFRAFAGPALAAGLAAMLTAGVMSVLAERANQGEEAAQLAQLAETQDEIAELEARHRSLESDLVLANKAIMVLRSDQMQSLALVGTSGMPKARGRVFWDWKNWYCYLHAEGFAPDPARLYAMWLFTEDGAVIAIGTFHPDTHGDATFLAPVPHDVGHVVRAGVSLEPDEDLGSKPRGEVVMLGST